MPDHHESGPTHAPAGEEGGGGGPAKILAEVGKVLSPKEVANGLIQPIIGEPFTKAILDDLVVGTGSELIIGGTSGGAPVKGGSGGGGGAHKGH